MFSACAARIGNPIYSQTPVKEAIKLSEVGDKLSFPRPVLTVGDRRIAISQRLMTMAPGDTPPQGQDRLKL